MANSDFVDPNQQPPLFGGNNLLGTAQQGMFGGLRRGFRAGGQALHPYSNRLMLAGLGMLGGGPQDAMKGLVAGSALDMEDADRRKLNELLRGLQNDPESSSLMKGFTQAERNYIQNDPVAVRTLLAGKLGVGSGRGQYGLTPIWGTDENGNPVAYQPSSAGGAQQIDFPEGFNPNPSGNRTIDTGMEIITQDRFGNEISRVPKQPAETAAATAGGKRQGEIDIPAVEGAAETMTAMIDDVINDPGRTQRTGWQSIVPAAPGTPAFEFEQKNKQLQGQAFKQAFETLRGGGAISEAEGAAATAAISRLDTRLGDDAYLRALNDLRGEVKRLVKIARARAGQPVPAEGSADDPMGLGGR